MVELVANTKGEPFVLISLVAAPTVEKVPLMKEIAFASGAKEKALADTADTAAIAKAPFVRFLEIVIIVI
jgi:hypothetical protein